MHNDIKEFHKKYIHKRSNAANTYKNIKHKLSCFSIDGIDYEYRDLRSIVEKLKTSKYDSVSYIYIC